MRDAEGPRHPTLKPEDKFEMTNKGTNGQLQKMLSPRVVQTIKHVAPTANMKKIRDEGIAPFIFWRPTATAE